MNQREVWFAAAASSQAPPSIPSPPTLALHPLHKSSVPKVTPPAQSSASQSRSPREGRGPASRPAPRTSPLSTPSHPASPSQALTPPALTYLNPCTEPQSPLFYPKRIANSITEGRQGPCFLPRTSCTHPPSSCPSNFISHPSQALTPPRHTPFPRPHAPSLTQNALQTQ